VVRAPATSEASGLYYKVLGPFFLLGKRHRNARRPQPAFARRVGTALQVEGLNRAALAGFRIRYAPHHDAEIGPSAELADGLHVDTPAEQLLGERPTRGGGPGHRLRGTRVGSEIGPSGYSPLLYSSRGLNCATRCGSRRHASDAST